MAVIDSLKGLSRAQCHKVGTAAFHKAPNGLRQPKLDPSAHPPAPPPQTQNTQHKITIARPLSPRDPSAEPRPPSLCVSKRVASQESRFARSPLCDSLAHTLAVSPLPVRSMSPPRSRPANPEPSTPHLNRPSSFCVKRLSRSRPTPAPRDAHSDLKPTPAEPLYQKLRSSKLETRDPRDPKP